MVVSRFKCMTNEGNVVVEYLWTKESCKSTGFDKAEFEYSVLV